MSSNLPIVRDNRVRDRLAAVGQTLFTFDAPLFDAADLKVFVKTPASEYFVQRTSGFDVALLAGNSGASVVFSLPPLAEGGASPVTVRLQGARVHTRLLDVTRGGIVRSQSLEAELDRQTLVLQELRRDVDATEGAAQTATGAAAIATTKAGAASASAETAVASAEAAGQAAALAGYLANAAPGTPVGDGFSARHWAATAQALADGLDLGNYSTTTQILALLGDYVPTTRTVASGLGVKINGGASAPLSGTVTVGLDLASDAETVAGLLTNKPAAPSGVHAAIVAALAGISTTALKNVRLITASGSITPSAGVTKWLGFVVGGGGASGATVNGASGQGIASGGGGGGGGSLFNADVNPTNSYPATIGAGGVGVNSAAAQGGTGGTTSITIAGTTYSGGGGGGGYGNGNGTGTGGNGGAGSGGGFPVAGQNGSGGAGTTASQGGPGAGGSGGLGAFALGYGRGGHGRGETGPGFAGGTNGYAGCILILEF